MKTKSLKAFTLAELIIVMAIFGMIMMGALALINPVRELFTTTARYENVRASMDNVNNILETTIRNANRLHMYVGWESFNDIIAPMDNTKTPPTNIWNKNISDITSVGGLKTWGSPTATASAPIDYFRKRFLLVDMEFKGEFSKTIDGVDYIFTHTIETKARGTLDTALADNALDIYVLGIVHKQNTDSTLDDFGDPTEIADIYLEKFKGGVSLGKTPAINPAYLKNYDFKLIFGQVATDPSSDTFNRILWDLSDTENLVFNGNNKDSRLISPTNPVGTSDGNFFYDGVLGVTLMAKPKPTNKEPNPTYRNSNLIMSNAMKLDRINDKDGNPLLEALYFDVKSSTLKSNSPVSGTYDNTYDPIRINSAIDNNMQKFESGYSYSKYPIRQDGMIGEIIAGEDKTGDSTDPYLILTNRFKAIGYYDLKFVERAGEEKYNSIPYVRKFEEYYESSLTNPKNTLDVAQTANVFIVFTLPKDFSVANIMS